MVDAVISFVVNKIRDCLIQEAVRFQGVKKEVETLENELMKWKQSSLEDAKRKQVDDVIIRKWVSDIRDVAYDIEYVLDTFTLKIEEEEAPKRRRRICAFIKKFFCFFSKGEKAVNQHNIGKKMEEIRQKLGDISLKREQYRLDNLTSLRTLKNINVNCWSKIIPEKLGYLRELRIESKLAVSKEFDLEPIGKLKSLQFLSVKLQSDQSFASWQALAHCTCLVDLRLSGKIEKLPRNMGELLPNLEYLKLSGFILRDDPMALLENLPNLMFLVLKFVYSKEKMICSASGFPRLEILQFDCYEWVEWQVHEDSMPMLRGLKILEIIPRFIIPERLRLIPPPAEWKYVDDRYF